MIRRLLPIALLTGAGQLFSIFAIKSIAANSAVDAFSDFVQADAFYQLLLSVIAFGLQSMAMRELVLSADWKLLLKQYQSARICMAILLLPICLLAFWKPSYIVFLIAPLLAANADYAVYARGYPVFGALMAFLRMIIPYGITLVIVHIAPDKVLYAFVASLMPVFFITDWLIMRRLSVTFINTPYWRDILLYVKSLLLGLVGLGQYMVGLGLMLLVPYFVTEAASHAVFVGLKLYVIYKGVVRIIHQAYLREMLMPKVNINVDQLSMLVALFYCSGLFFFPEASVRLFFGERFLPYIYYYQLTGIAALIYAFLNTQSTILMLQRRDKPLALCTLTGVGTMFLTLISGALFGDAAWIAGLALVMGESAVSVCLYSVAKPVPLMKQRIAFVFKVSLIFIIPCLLRYAVGDILWSLLLSYVIVGIVCALLYGRKFVAGPMQ